jgi:hypothetical protein
VPDDIWMVSVNGSDSLFNDETKSNKKIHPHNFSRANISFSIRTDDCGWKNELIPVYNRVSLLFNWDWLNNRREFLDLFYRWYQWGAYDSRYEKIWDQKFYHTKSNSSSKNSATEQSIGEEFRVYSILVTKMRRMNKTINPRKKKNHLGWIKCVHKFSFLLLDGLSSESDFNMQLGGKFLLFKIILSKSSEIGDKIILFSRSL